MGCRTTWLIIRFRDREKPRIFLEYFWGGPIKAKQRREYSSGCCWPDPPSATAVYPDKLWSTAELVSWCWVRRTAFRPRHYERVRRYVREIAVPCGRGGGRGRPLLWRQREPT
jgi:hypothetical protein